MSALSVRLRALASSGMTAKQLGVLEEVASALDAHAREIAELAEAPDVNDERETLHTIAQAIGDTEYAERPADGVTPP